MVIVNGKRYLTATMHLQGGLAGFWLVKAASGLRAECEPIFASPHKKIALSALGMLTAADEGSEFVSQDGTLTAIPKQSATRDGGAN